MKATSPKLTKYTVTYTLNEVQNNIVQAWAKELGTTPERAFERIMLLGSTFEVQEKIDLIKAHLKI